MTRAKGDQGLLAGLRIIEIGQRIAGPVAAMVLAEQGAEVIRIVDPSKPPRDPVLDALLARGKTELALDLSSAEGKATLKQLVTQADVVLENRAPGTMEQLGLDFDDVRATTNPGLISCSIPNFCPSDPRKELPDYEALVSTAGYLYEKPIGAPQVHDFPLGSALAALFSANGVLAAIIARLRTGQGQHVSASIFHSNIFAQVVLVLMRTGIPRGFLPLKMVGTPFMGSWLCGDERHIYLHISLPAHNARILEILEAHGYEDQVAQLRQVLSEETMSDPSQVKSIAEAKAIRSLYEGIFRSRPAMEWEELLGRELCCIKVRTVDEWIPDTIAAGMADACTIDDPVFGEMMAPGASVTVEEYPPLIAPRTSCADAAALLARWQQPRQHGPVEGRQLEPQLEHPLQGIRVMDISRVIAGPCAARILSELGAEVLSVQRPTSLDWALSFHLLFNAGKTSCTIDFANDEGKRKLWTLMDKFQPHAFIQNYRHIELARTIGVGPEHLRAHFPNIAYTHLNAYGNLGIWRDRPGFEQVVQAVSGIQMTYGRGGKPKLLPTPVIDIGSGLLGAFSALLGLYQQHRTGEGVFGSTHLTRTAVLFQILPIVDYQRQRCLKHAQNRGLEVAFEPQRQIISGIFRARDAFCCVAGPADDVKTWLTCAKLYNGANGINPLEALPWWRMLYSFAHWKQSIADAGLADTVAIVKVPRIKRMLDEMPQFDDAVPSVWRRTYSGVEQDLTFIRNPIRLSKTPAKEIATAPMRGEHTAEVMQSIGEEAPGGAVIPYPEAKPILVWTLTLVRWGYFAWRSGNI